MFDIRFDERALAKLIPRLQANKRPELSFFDRPNAKLDQPGQVSRFADGYGATRPAAAPVLVARNAEQIVIAAVNQRRLCSRSSARAKLTMRRMRLL